MLLRDEPHPDLLVEPSPKLRDWTPELENYMWRYLGWHPIQRTLIRVCLGVDPGPEGEEVLRSLQQEDRYFSDPDPTVFILCMGRRSGKTTILQGIADTLAHIYRASDGDSRFAIDHYQLRGVGPRTSYSTFRNHNIIVDERLEIPDLWSSISSGDGRRYIVAHTPRPSVEPFTALPRTVRRAVFSISTSQIFPGRSFHPGVDPTEFVVPRVDEILRRLAGGV